MTDLRGIGNAAEHRSHLNAQRNLEKHEARKKERGTAAVQRTYMSAHTLRLPIVLCLFFQESKELHPMPDLLLQAAILCPSFTPALLCLLTASLPSLYTRSQNMSFSFNINKFATHPLSIHPARNPNEHRFGDGAHAPTSSLVQKFKVIRRTCAALFPSCAAHAAVSNDQGFA